MDRRGRLHRGPRPPARRGGAKKGAAVSGKGAPTRVEPVPGEALGRSRGGLSSKLHLAVEGRGRPLAVLLTPGQAGDNPQLPGLLAAIRVPAGGVGRPRTRPEHVVADKAYSARATRTLLRRRGIRATIPEREDEKAHRRRRGRAGGRPPTFDPDRYRGRNLIERCVNRLKQYRALATRYAKRAELYRGLVVLAAILTWLT